MRVHDFLLQQVDFVEEEDDGGALEPLVGDDGLEQRHALLHPVLWEKGEKEEAHMSLLEQSGGEKKSVTKELPLQAHPAHCGHEGRRWRRKRANQEESPRSRIQPGPGRTR